MKSKTRVHKNNRKRSHSGKIRF